MDKILINEMAFYGYHGVLEEEKNIGQRFFIDLELFLSLEKAGNSDSVSDTVNYALVYESVKAIVENNKFDLIERLASEIANTLLKEFPLIKEILVKVKKPEAPIKGVLKDVQVEIRRKGV